MAILFFNLRGVPQDEADDVRELLNSNAIEFYETFDGSWGVSMPAIWLYHEADLSIAQPLFDAYQQQRSLNQRALYQQLKQAKQHQGFWARTCEHPLRFLVFSSCIALVSYASVKWVFELGL